MKTLDLRTTRTFGRRRAHFNRVQTATIVTVFILTVVAGMFYMAWIDSGCDRQGAITTSGRICV